MAINKEAYPSPDEPIRDPAHDGTDVSRDLPFQALAPEDKGAEFDKSYQDPRGYAERNFK